MCQYLPVSCSFTERHIPSEALQHLRSSFYQDQADYITGGHCFQVRPGPGFLKYPVTPAASGMLGLQVRATSPGFSDQCGCFPSVAQCWASFHHCPVRDQNASLYGTRRSQQLSDLFPAGWLHGWLALLSLCSTQSQPEFPQLSPLPHTPGCHLIFLKISPLPTKSSDCLFCPWATALALSPSHLPALNLELIQWV